MLLSCRLRFSNHREKARIWEPASEVLMTVLPMTFTVRTWVEDDFIWKAFWGTRDRMSLKSLGLVVLKNSILHHEDINEIDITVQKVRSSSLSKFEKCELQVTRIYCPKVSSYTVDFVKWISCG